MEQGSWVEYHPLTMVSDGSSIEFDVSGTGDDYIDFANTMLYVKAKVLQANGNNLAADTEVGPVNLFLHSLFSQVDISLNGNLITSSTNTYPYRAMLETGKMPRRLSSRLLSTTRTLPAKWTALILLLPTSIPVYGYET